MNYNILYILTETSPKDTSEDISVCLQCDAEFITTHESFITGTTFHAEAGHPKLLLVCVFFGEFSLSLVKYFQKAGAADSI